MQTPRDIHKLFSRKNTHRKVQSNMAAQKVDFACGPDSANGRTIYNEANKRQNVS